MCYVITATDQKKSHQYRAHSNTGEGYMTYLIWWQRSKRLDDSGQWHLGLLGHISCARHIIGCTANIPRTGIPYKQTQF